MVIRHSTILSPLRRRKILTSPSNTIYTSCNKIIFPSLSLSLTSLTINQQQQQSAMAFSRSLSRSYQQQQRTSSWEYYLGLTAAAASTLLIGNNLIGSPSLYSIMALHETITSSATKTRCDYNECNSNDKGNKGDENETEIDPYDDLPEQDEPTNCSICLTYRRGPCRPYWRKVEACTKDNEISNKEKDKKEDNGNDDDGGDFKSNKEEEPNNNDPKCFKYMMPWIDCASRYRNLYTLIEMDTQYTEGVIELEENSLHFRWSPGKEPIIDWTNWKNYLVESNNEPQKQQQQNSSSTPTSTIPLWNTFDPMLGDPELITVETTVPVTMGAGILECAYALDQDNNVIGFAYGTKPSDAAAATGTVQQQKEGREINDGSNNDSDNKKEETVTLGIRVAPSRTEQIILAGSYTHPSSQKNKNAVESHLYKSQPLFLNDVAPPRPEIKTARYNVRRE